jgi:outer membrane biosynthesis protein TonB
MTRSARTPHLGVALAIALVFLAYVGVARAQVVEEPVSEAPAAPAEPPTDVTEPPVSEPPTTPAEPPTDVTEPPVSEPPTTPAEPPTDVTEPPVSEPPKTPAASGSGDSIVVINSDAPAPGIDTAFSVPPSDSATGAVTGVDPSAPRSDPSRAGKRASPSVFDPRRIPTVPRAPAPAGAGASGGSGGGLSGGLFAALVGSLILVAPGLGRLLSLSLTPLRAPTLVASLERPD